MIENIQTGDFHQQKFFRSGLLWCSDCTFSTRTQQHSSTQLYGVWLVFHYQESEKIHNVTLSERNRTTVIMEATLNILLSLWVFVRLLVCPNSKVPPKPLKYYNLAVQMLKAVVLLDFFLHRHGFSICRLGTSDSTSNQWPTVFQVTFLVRFGTQKKGNFTT